METHRGDTEIAKMKQVEKRSLKQFFAWLVLSLRTLRLCGELRGERV